MSWRAALASPLILAPLLASFLATGACTSAELYGARAPLGGADSVATPDASRPRLVSAHFAHDAPPGRTAEDELLLVFSTEVDPSTLDADAFVVVLTNGDLSYPSRALLDPADEVDENRSVTLVGDFGDPEKNAPLAVRILGNVYGEDGNPLSDLDADIRGFATPDEMVWLEVVKPAEHRCVGARQVVRTYWSDSLRAVDAEDLGKVKVSFTDGSEVAPLAFDDHADLSGEQSGQAGEQSGEAGEQTADDNVLDLCLGRDAPISNVSVAKAAFADRSGHATAPTSRAPSAGQ